MWALWILSIFHTLSCLYDRLCTTVQIIVAAVKEAFGDQLYIFIEGRAFAYKANKVITSSASSARPSWLYNATEGCFHEWCGSLFSTSLKGDYKRTLPFLSLELVEGDRVVYDLTDFIEKLVVYTEEASDLYPSLEQVIAAWSTSSHILVDEGRHRIRMMDTSAQTIERGFHEDVESEDVENDDDETPPVWPPISRTAMTTAIGEVVSDADESLNPKEE